MNRRFLFDLGSSWDDIFDLPGNWQTLQRAREYKKEIKKVIAADFGAEAIFAVKDPSMCVLLPVWMEALNELKIEPHFIILVRNPFEIAESLNKRNDFPKEKSILLWIKYMLNAEFFSREQPRIFIKYKDLISDPASVIEKTQAKLNLMFPKKFNDERARVESFLESSLNHHSHDDDISGKTSFFIASALWKRLSAWADIKDTKGPQPPYLEDLRTDFQKIRELFLSPDLKKSLNENNRQLQDKKRELKRIYDSTAWRIAYVLALPIMIARSLFAFMRMAFKKDAVDGGI